MTVELTGGVANRGRVFRVGNTVHRPLANPHRARHQVLDHLRTAGFLAAPILLEVRGPVEVLSWIPGCPARLPLPEWALDDELLISVAELVAGFHRAMTSFDGTDQEWPADAVPVAYRDGSVSHNDLHPGNIVFDGSSAVGLIDFDLAGPGSVAWDLATLARNFCPLQDDLDMPARLLGRRIARFDLLLDAYGADAALRAAVGQALVANHDWTYRIVTDAALGGHAGFRHFWSTVAGRARRERRWIAAHVDALAGQRGGARRESPPAGRR
ncbi:MAG: phosphotransferase [bacterium]